MNTDPYTIAPLPPAEQLVGNAEQFPVLNHWSFFNHGGVAPLPKVAADAFRTFVAQAEKESYLSGTWYKPLEKLRAGAARMINADADEIALVKNTSEALSFVAAGIDWKPGDRIAFPSREYPSNQYPWLDLARKGVESVRVAEVVRDDGAAIVPIEALLKAAEHPRTRMIALSHVQFASGYRSDLATIGAFCKQRGILFCVDAIQTWGVLPIDVKAMHIDFAAADGHKWLLGPEGAGFFYVRQAIMDELHPVELGWNSVKDSANYNKIDLTLKRTAERYEAGTLTVPAFLSLWASVQLLEHVGIDFVSKRLHRLSQIATDGAKAKGWTVACSRAEGETSGAACIYSPNHNLQELALKLRTEHKIESVVRGGRLRATPHFYTPDEQMERFVELLPRG